MNRKILIVISLCLVATLVISPVFAPAANSLLEIVKDIQTMATTIISDLSSVKSDTSLITTTQTNLGDWTLLGGTSRDEEETYSILRVMVSEDEAAQFTITLKSVLYLEAQLEVWVDVNDDNSANALALEVDMDALTPNYGTATFVGNSFTLLLRVPANAEPVPNDKEINWAYMVVAPPGVVITEDIWLS